MLCPDAGRVNTATIETVVPRYPSAGRAVARFGAAREIHTLYKTEVQQHPLRRRSRLRKPLPCCAEEFDRAHPSIAWRRVPVPEMQRLRPIGREVSLGRSDIWEVFSQPPGISSLTMNRGMGRGKTECGAVDVQAKRKNPRSLSCTSGRSLLGKKGSRRVVHPKG